jgi:hypothetical protein
MDIELQLDMIMYLPKKYQIETAISAGKYDMLTRTQTIDKIALIPLIGAYNGFGKSLRLCLLNFKLLFVG